jgi:hydrogenase maturation protease
MTHKRILILGLGNLLLSDEGVGIHVIQELQKKSFPPNINLVDGGTGGFELIRFIRDMDKVVIIDAIKSDEKPGSVFRFTPEELDVAEFHPLSAHQGGLAELLTETKKLNPMPDIVIYGIVAGKIDQYNMQLSAEVEKKIPSLISSISKEIENGMK